MGRSASRSSFIHELKLKITPQQNKMLNIRLDVARQIYNACLGEALKRLQLMRNSKLYQKTIKLPKSTNESGKKSVLNKERADNFRQLRKRYNFSEYALHKYLTCFYSNTWLTRHIDSLTAQKITTRAFNAVEQYCYGKRGKPRFQGKNRFRSVEGKNNTSGIRFINGKIIWSTKKSQKLILTPEYDVKDKHGLEVYALDHRTKYVRLVRKELKGYLVWYAQLVQEGTAYIKEKNQLGKGIVGLDIGPSTIAAVGASKASLQLFCHELEDYRQNIAKTQRQLSRSLRAMNIDNFEEDDFRTNYNGKSIKKQGKIKSVQTGVYVRS